MSGMCEMSGDACGACGRLHYQRNRKVLLPEGLWVAEQGWDGVRMRSISMTFGSF